MSVEIEEYVPPNAVQLFSQPIPPNSGEVWPVGEADDIGWPHTRGGTPKRAFIAWGEDGQAPAWAQWIKATELEGLETENGLPAYLYAAYCDGKLFLQIADEDPPRETERAGEDAESWGGYIGETDEDGTTFTQKRGVSPEVVITQYDDRESVLKAPSGKWRADLGWDILCTYYYRTSNTWTQYNEHPARVATVWLVTCGNILIFWTTACEWHTAAGGQVYRARNWAAFGSVTRCYDHDPRGEYDGVPSGQDWQDALGSTVPVVLGATAALCGFMHVAPLPWQDGGGQAVYDDEDESAELGYGSLNCTLTDEDGWPIGNGSQVPDGGISACPRLHFGNGLSSYSGGAQYTPTQVATILYGWESDFTVQGVRYTLAGLDVVPAFNLLFAPWAVEGLGLYKRGTLDFARVDARTYLPDATVNGWKRLANATLRGPAGPLYLDIAGAEVEGCLLTASGSTEYTS